MDAEIVILRLLHIVPGAVWVGSAIFLAFVLQPALKVTGPPHAGAVMANMVYGEHGQANGDNSPHIGVADNDLWRRDGIPRS